MPPRPESPRLAPDAQAHVDTYHREIVDRVAAAVKADRVVVVGMAWNPSVGRVRKALEAAGIPFTYIEHGNYLTGWRDRLAIKLWSGWPTFPQVYFEGTLLGGNELTQAAIAAGTIGKP